MESLPRGGIFFVDIPLLWQVRLWPRKYSSGFGLIIHHDDTCAMVLFIPSL
jgi:hypothetical protein